MANAATDPKKVTRMDLALIKNHLGHISSQRHIDSSIFAEEVTIPLHSILQHSILQLCLREECSSGCRLCFECCIALLLPACAHVSFSSSLVFRFSPSLLA